MLQMSEGSEAVTVRRLPDGDVQPARMEVREPHQLLIALPNEPTCKFEAGALIEIQSSETIYLGTVLHQRNSGMAISIEHSVNRAALAEIEDAWRDP
jgi:hypothetical protein